MTNILQRLRSSGLAERYRLRAQLASDASPEAAQAAQHLLADDTASRLTLAGTDLKPVFIGSPPRWWDNPTGNPEFNAELNRMFHWERMARAYALTGKSSYAEQILSELDNWIETCPVPPISEDSVKLHEAFNSQTPWRSLEVGLRMERTWPAVIEALCESPLFTPERIERIVTCMQAHGRVLFSVCPRFWPKADHNHYLTENAGLLRLALLFPELPESEVWSRHAQKELERCLRMQLTTDGGQIEGCPGYHNVCLRTFSLIVIFAKESGIIFSTEFLDRLRGAMAYSLHSYRPSGTMVPLGDSDATPTPPITALLVAALALDRWEEVEQLRKFAPPAAFREAVAAVIWQAPDPIAWVNRANHVTAQEPLIRSHWQRELGQAMMRTDWSSDAASVAVTCRTPVNNGHAHIDPASFDFSAFGRPLAVDPARFSYAETKARRDFKSATWHNTITVNHCEPFAYIDTWNFGPQQPGTIRRLLSAPSWQATECVHENFSPTLHHRLVLLLDEPKALVVVDSLNGLAPADTVQLWFHLDSILVEFDPACASAQTNDPGLANLRVQSASGLELSSHPGRVSDIPDSAHPSTRLCFADKGGPSHRVYSTVLLPRPSDAKDWPSLSVVQELSGPGIRLLIHYGDRKRLVTWNPGRELQFSIAAALNG